MGCIEIDLKDEGWGRYTGFNRNMGCIEINGRNTTTVCRASLIETWDVLK